MKIVRSQWRAKGSLNLENIFSAIETTSLRPLECAHTAWKFSKLSLEFACLSIRDGVLPSKGEEVVLGVSAMLSGLAC